MTMRDWLMPTFMFLVLFVLCTMAVCAAIFRAKETTLYVLVGVCVWLVACGLFLAKMDLSFGD